MARTLKLHIARRCMSCGNISGMFILLELRCW